MVAGTFLTVSALPSSPTLVDKLFFYFGKTVFLTLTSEFLLVFKCIGYVLGLDIGKKAQHLCSALHGIQTILKHSGMNHTV